MFSLSRCVSIERKKGANWIYRSKFAYENLVETGQFKKTKVFNKKLLCSNEVVFQLSKFAKL